MHIQDQLSILAEELADLLKSTNDKIGILSYPIEAQRTVCQKQGSGRVMFRVALDEGDAGSKVTRSSGRRYN
jgi:hypothetical protein